MREQSDAVGQAEANLRPAEVAERVGVSPATLRRWSRRFEDHLGLGNDEDNGRSHRRYTEGDVATLLHVKSLLDQGWTYDQVADQLRQSALSPNSHDGPPAGLQDARSDDLDDELPDGGAPDPDEDDRPGGESLMVAGQSGTGGNQLPVEALPPAVQFLRDAVHAVTDTQQIILNSQQASRDLLGVMIQDNLNLKGENTSLRERMLDMERELAEMRRRHADYRERMETRVRVLEDAVANLMARQQPPATPAQAPGQAQQSQSQQPPPPPQERRSFWSRLIGG
jgi:DNA-binding transcriptional MerR regulator